jgi:hypothetical protein
MSHEEMEVIVAAEEQAPKELGKYSDFPKNLQWEQEAIVFAG